MLRAQLAIAIGCASPVRARPWSCCCGSAPSPPLSRGAPPVLLQKKEAFQAQAGLIPNDVEFPGLDWEGWQAIADTLGISGMVDAPIFRHGTQSRPPPPGNSRGSSAPHNAADLSRVLACSAPRCLQNAAGGQDCGGCRCRQPERRPRQVQRC